MKFRILFLAATTIILAVGCTGTPEFPRTPENLAGTWQLVLEKGWEMRAGRKSTWVIEYNGVKFEPVGKEEPYYEVWTFGTEDMCIEIKDCNGRTLRTDRHDYECSGDTLVLSGPTQRHFDRTAYRIEKLTASQLVLTERTNGAYGKVDWTLVFSPAKTMTAQELCEAELPCIAPKTPFLTGRGRE